MKFLNLFKKKQPRSPQKSTPSDMPDIILKTDQHLSEEKKQAIINIVRENLHSDMAVPIITWKIAELTGSPNPIYFEVYSGRIEVTF